MKPAERFKPIGRGSEVVKRAARPRSKKGSALSEFGPAFFLLLTFGLLPVIDVLAMGVDYAAAFYLNELQLREAQKLPKSVATSEKGPVIEAVPRLWRSGLIGGFSAANTQIVTTVGYKPVPWQPVGQSQTLDFWFVTVSTTASFRPFLTIPFLNGVPGLGSPITYTVAGRRPVENNRFLNE
jgi:hypothetical protein